MSNDADLQKCSEALKNTAGVPVKGSDSVIMNAVNSGNEGNNLDFTLDKPGSTSEKCLPSTKDEQQQSASPPNKSLKLQFHFDGLTLLGSSKRELWPILGKVYSEEDYFDPFVIAVHRGRGKLERFHQYLWKYVDELNELSRKGIVIDNIQFEVEVMSIGAGTPARALIKCTIEHGGYCCCERCTVIGFMVDGTTIYQENHDRSLAHDALSNVYINSPDAEGKKDEKMPVFTETILLRDIGRIIKDSKDWDGERVQDARKSEKNISGNETTKKYKKSSDNVVVTPGDVLNVSQIPYLVSANQ
ncbi:hypothetical protein QAD02_012508 [Eretmocerus hayati]|uniref:Uncharacterized protein n=1 Tax=Eretmocerus hayati TaxID=131215 RepID=A0ACC2P1K2_9HYME|nr:hypothetical protein QAD02_012508 [Eretmocerus hayati]